MAKPLSKAFRKGSSSPTTILANNLKKKHFPQQYAVIILAALLSKAVEEICDEIGLEIHSQPVAGWGPLERSEKPRHPTLPDEEAASQSMISLRAATDKLVSTYKAANDKTREIYSSIFQIARKADLYIKDLEQRAAYSVIIPSGVKAFYQPKPALALHIAAELVNGMGESYRRRTGRPLSEDKNSHILKDHAAYYDEVASRFPLNDENPSTLSAMDACKELTSLLSEITALRFERDPRGLPNETALSPEEKLISYVLRHYIRPYALEGVAAEKTPEGPKQGELVEFQLPGRAWEPGIYV